MCNPYQNQLRFRVVDFRTISEDAYGVYGIWFGLQCLYVGQAKLQPIAKRLEQHWKFADNPKLRMWIEAKGPELTVAVRRIEDHAKIDCFERFYIHKFQPLTNVIRYERSRRLSAKQSDGGD